MQNIYLNECTCIEQKKIQQSFNQFIYIHKVQCGILLTYCIIPFFSIMCIGTTFPLAITMAGTLHMTQMLMLSWWTRLDSQRTRLIREVLSLKTTQMSRSSLRRTLNWSSQSTLPSLAVPLRTGKDQE